jgi:large subunit ribosomal protein L22
MEKKVKSKEELLNEKDQILDVYNKTHKQFQKPALLQKRRKRCLG